MLTKASLYPALLLFAALWCGLLVLTGSLFSGYHLTDDHEILAIHHELSDPVNSVGGVAMKRVVKDLSIRFRPVYYLHRVMETKVFGTNFVAWSAYTGCLAILVSTILFIFGRVIGFSWLQSVLFSCLTLTGQQAELWWRLGPAETPGMVLFALVLLCVALTVYAQTRRTLYTILCCVFVVLMSMTKENFLLTIPAVLFLMVWLYRRRNLVRWGVAIRANRVAIVFLMLFFAGEFSFVEYFLNSASIGNVPPAPFDFSGLIRIVTDAIHGENLVNFFWIIIPGGAAIVAFLLLNRKRILLERPLVNEAAHAFIFSLLIAVPQLFVYSHVGLQSHYLLPLMLAFGFGSSYCAYLFRRLSNSAGAGISLALALLLAFQIKGNYIRTREFAREGNNLGTIFSSIERVTDGNSPVVVVADPVVNFEWAYSFRLYLSIELGRDKVYAYAATPSRVAEGFQESLVRNFKKNFESRNFEDLKDTETIKVVLIFPELEGRFLNQAKWFKPNDYERGVYDFFVTYCRKTPRQSS